MTTATIGIKNKENCAHSENMHKESGKLDTFKEKRLVGSLNENRVTSQNSKDHIADDRKMVNLDNLEFIKLKFPRLIHIDLIEAVKGRTFTPEQFYKYQEDQIKYENPGNLLYALATPDKKIHGYLWAEISQIDGSMFVNTFSISKDYWHKGEAIPKAIAFLETLKAKYKCSRIFWITTNEKFFLKHNFKRSKNVLMEYN